jgi:predicted ATPase
MNNPDRENDRYLAPMVGRRQEMQILLQAWQDLLTHRKAGVIFLTGEAGVGKSRLVIEFSRLALADGAAVLHAQSLTNQPVVTYWLFMDLLRNSLGVQVDTPPPEISRKLVEQVNALMGPQAMDALPYLAHLLSLPPSDPSMEQRVEFLDPDRLRQRILLAVRSYLEALARKQPLILILEDMLQADEPSLDLLISLFELLSESPILMITVSRPFLKGELKRVRDAAAAQLGESCQNLYLPRLVPQECKAILEQFLGPNDLPEKMHVNIIHQSGGIPFYIEEIVRMLIDVGALRRTSDQWQATGTANLERFGVPETLQHLIRWRFNRLLPVQRQILQVASVIGKTFSDRVLQHILNSLSQEELKRQLKYLCKLGFLFAPLEKTSAHWEFRQNLTLETIYAALPEVECARIHGQVGQALEALFASQISSYIDLLAHHFGSSDQKKSALQYLSQAGQKAARRYLNEPARRYFKSAQALLPDVTHEPLQAMEIYMGLGDVQLLVGEYHQARQNYENALQVIASMPKLKVLGHTCSLERKIGTIYERKGDFELALQNLKKACDLVEDPSRPFPAEQAQVLSDMGWIKFRLSNFSDAENDLIRALSLAQQARRYDITASIYNRLGGVYWQKDDLEKATNFVQKSIALRDEIGDIVAVARSYNNLGLLDWKRGKWASALENFNRSLSMHANFGDIEGLIDVQGNLGLLHLDRGSIAEANVHFQASLAKARQIGHNYIVAMTLMYISRMYMALEEWKTSHDYAQQSLNAFEALGAQDELLDVFNLLGQSCLGMGDLTQAAAWAEKALQVMPRQADGSLDLRTDDAGRTLRFLGELCRKKQELDEADHMFKASLELFTRLGNSLEQARTMIAQAGLTVDRGDLAASRVLLNEARLILRALGANLDLQRLEALTNSAI